MTHALVIRVRAEVSVSGQRKVKVTRANVRPHARARSVKKVS
jgi:hypothetical protein